MQDVLDTLLDYLHEHWIKFITAGCLMGIGWVFGRHRARNDWQKKEFFGRLNVSLNSFQNGALLIRTIIEKSCADVFLNDIATETITAAARATTETDPILPLPKDDYWYYLNAVLNEIAEKFALGQIQRDLGRPVAAEKYLICLTSECAGAIRTRKVRAMLIQKKLLEHLPEKAPKFESPTHSTRWQTLHILAKEWKANPHKFLEIEICL